MTNDEKEAQKAEKEAKEKEAADAAAAKKSEAGETKSEAKRKAHWPKGWKPTGDEIADTKFLLENGEQMNFMIPLAPGDAPGAKEMVQINGYKMEVPKGVMTTIPTPMANILARKYNVDIMLAQRSNAGWKEDQRKALE